MVRSVERRVFRLLLSFVQGLKTPMNCRGCGEIVDAQGKSSFLGGSAVRGEGIDVGRIRGLVKRECFQKFEEVERASKRGLQGPS
jgi:hypothetical protein